MGWWSKAMKSLDDYNAERGAMLDEVFRQLGARAPAGVACPKCWTEMVYENANSLQLTNPPTRAVICPTCDRRGNKIS